MSLLGNPLVQTSFPVNYFTGDANTTAFTLSQAAASVNAIEVYVNGLHIPPTAYTVSGTGLNFLSAPGSGAAIVVRGLGVRGTVGVPSAGTVSPPTLSSGAPTWDTSGNVTVLSNLTVNGGQITGNASSATKLTPGHTINGVLFDGSANISVNVLETQVTDGVLLARVADNETITGNWTFNNPVVGVDPVSASQLATKNYVDNIATGITWKQPVRLATTTNIALTGLFAIDGITPAAGTRVLVKNQTTPAQDGVYITGSGAWTRAADFDATAEVNGSAILVTEGTSQADTGWVQTAEVTTVGSSSMTFVQFQGAGTYNGGAGLTLTGNTFDVGTASTSRIVVNPDTIDLAAVTDSGTGTFLKISKDGYGRTTGTTPVVAADITPLVNSVYVLKSGDTMTGSLTATSFIGPLTGTVTGNASTATKLQTPRTIALTGDGAWSVSFDGSANATGVLTLTTVGTPVNSAFVKLTTDANGRVTATTPVASTDIAGLLSYTGDITTSGSVATLATVNSNVGQFSAITVNAKGLTTAATNLALTGDVTGTASGASLATTLASVGTPVTAAFVKLTTDAKGRVTATTPVVVGDISALTDARYVLKAGDTMTGALTVTGSGALGLITAASAYNSGTTVSVPGLDNGQILVVSNTNVTIANGAPATDSRLLAFGGFINGNAFIRNASAGNTTFMAGTIDRMTIGGTTGAFSFNGDYGTSGYVLTSAGGGAATAWVNSNIANDLRYVKKTGDTMTGALNITNGTYSAQFGAQAFSSTAFGVGTTTNNDFVIGTNSIARMRIDAAGNAGFGGSGGVTATNAKVNATTNGAQAAFSANGNTTATNTSDFLATRTGTQSAAIGYGALLQFGNTTSATFAGIQEYQGGIQLFGFSSTVWNEFMRIDTAGNGLFGGVASAGASTSAFGHGGTPQIFRQHNSGTGVNAQSHFMLSGSQTSIAGSAIGALTWALPGISTGAGGMMGYIGLTTDGAHTATTPATFMSFATRATTDSASGPATVRMNITSGGQVLIGTGATNNLRVNQKLGVVSVGSVGGASLTSYNTSTTGTTLDLQHANSGVDGTLTAISTAGFTTGAIAFRGSNGSAFGDGAVIASTSDGAWTTTSQPGNLSFYTTSSGAISGSEKMRINSAGAVSFASAFGTAGQLLTTNGTGASPTWTSLSTLGDSRYVQKTGDTMTGTLNVNVPAAALGLLVTGSDSTYGVRIVNSTATSGMNMSVGGAGSSAGGYLSSDAGPMWFTTNGVQRVTIDATGNLGIGTSTPSYNLDIVSSIAAKPVMRMLKSNSGTGSEAGGTFYFANQGPTNLARSSGAFAGRIIWQYSQPTSGALQDGAAILSSADGTQNGTGTQAILAFYTSDATGGGNNIERMRIDSNGNVSIGQIAASFSTAKLNVSDGTISSVYGYKTAATEYLGTTTNHALGFLTGNVVRAVIDATGKVGIGNSTPTYNLMIGSGTGSQVVAADGGIGAGQGAVFLFRQGGSPKGVFGTEAVIVGNGTSSRVLTQAYSDSLGLRTVAAQPITFDTNNVERMRIDSAGNVGIGTVPNAATLDIALNTSAYPITQVAARFSNGNSSGQTAIDFLHNGTFRGRVRSDFVGNMTYVTNGGAHSFLVNGDVNTGTTALTIGNNASVVSPYAAAFGGGLVGFNAIGLANGGTAANSTQNGHVWWLLAYLPPSTAGTYDTVQLWGSTNDNWNSFANNAVRIIFGNRGGFTAKFLSAEGYGGASYAARFVAYQASDGSISIYAFALQGYFTTHAAWIINSNQATIYANPQPTQVDPTSAAGGSKTVVFDSSSAKPFFVTSQTGGMAVTNTSTTGTGVTVTLPSGSNGAVGMSVSSVGPVSGPNWYNFVGQSGNGSTVTVNNILISSNGNIVNTNGSYGAISDERKKQDIVDAASQWDDLKAVRVRKFHMKTDPTGPLQIGVIAQELQQTSPGLVNEEQHPGEDDTTLVVQYSVLYMKAVKALQEAMTRIEALEAKVTALEVK